MPRPYRSAVRAEAAEETRNRIAQAAAALLRTGGADGFSLDSVAKAAGVTRLTVYNRFGSRRALLEAVFDDLAARGGLFRLHEAMAEEDPFSSLRQLIDIFCDFWSFDRDLLASLYAASAADRDFEASLRDRNERRRKAISGLVGRMAAAKTIRPDAAKDLADLLFVLSSFYVFSELTGSRAPDAARLLVQKAVEEALRSAGMKI